MKEVILTSYYDIVYEGKVSTLQGRDRIVLAYADLIDGEDPMYTSSYSMILWLNFKKDQPTFVVYNASNPTLIKEPNRTYFSYYRSFTSAQLALAYIESELERLPKEFTKSVSA